MKASKNFLILLIALFSFTLAYSQQRSVIRGRVVDSKDQTGVIGANIIEYDKDNRVINGTICDVNGYFSLEMKDQHNVVKVSIIGYVSKTIQVDPSKPMIIELNPSTTQLQEVKVLGRKSVEMPSLTNIKDRDIASAQVKVDLGDLKETGVLSAADALQGRVSGLDILASSGDPGSNSQLVIRGLSSMGNNKPLIVIDGIVQDYVPQSFNLASANQEDISDLLNIPVKDIKSITILKDAASTAIYGSKGADGVLVIETYKGRLGKVQFDYAYQFSLNIQPPAVPMLNGDEYIMLQLEEWHNAKGVYTTPPQIAYDPTYADFYNYSANTDWLGAITQNAITNNHYFSVSGGGEKTRYFTSVSYVDNGGTTINTDYKTFSTRVNLDYFLSDKLLFSVLFSYSNNITDNNLNLNTSWGGANNPVNIRAMAYIKAPNMSIYQYDQYGNPTGEYFTPITSYQGSGADYFNPVAVAKLGKNTNVENAMSNAFTLKYNILDWLVFNETLSFQYSGNKSKNYLPYNAMGSDWLDWTVNKAEEGNALSSNIMSESQFAFTLTADSSRHNFGGTINWITEEHVDQWMNIQSNKIPSTSIQDPSISGQINWIGDGSSQRRGLGALGTLNYKFLDRYLLQASVRSDANSAFGKNRLWGTFYGVSGAWRFSEEPFIKSLGIFGESMLHADYGLSGRQPSSTFTYSKYSLYLTANNGGYMTFPGIVPSQPALDNLQWESITSWDVGLKLNLLKNKLYIETDIYDKLSSNLLFQNYNVPTSSGFTTYALLNGGVMDNRGWEFSAEYQVLKTKNFSLSVNGNVSHNDNSFLSLPDNFNVEQNTDIGNGQYPQRVELGQPLGSFFGFHYLGVYSTDQDAFARDAKGNLLHDNQGSPIPMTFNGTYTFKGGDAKYEDVNHDGKIDLNDVVYLGNSNPKLYGGFGTSASYKRITLSCQFYYRLGFDIINGIAIQTQGMNDYNNQSDAVLRRWRTQGQAESDLLPRAFLYNPANNLGSDRYVEKGDYLRLLNLQLTYNFTKEFCEKLKIRSFGVTLSARKLLTFTSYSGQDPEIGQDATNPFWIGVDYARTPPPRIITANFSIGF